MDTIGKRIKNLRCNKMHMSQVAFADEINVSKQTLYKYENDIVTNIPSDKIEDIAKFCGVSPSYLMGWEDTNPLPEGAIPYVPEPMVNVPLVGSVNCGTPLFLSLIHI